LEKKPVATKQKEMMEYSFAVNTAFMQTNNANYKPMKYKLIKVRR